MNKTTITLLGLFFLMVGIAFADTLPGLPEVYYGTISGASAGLTITAKIGSTSVGSIITDSGTYGGGSPSSEKLTVCALGESGCTSGATITFSPSSGSIGTTSTFSPGAITELDLSYTAPTTPTTTDAGVTAGGSALTTETLTEVEESYIISRLEKTLPEGWEDANLKYSQVGDASTETFTENTVEGIEEALDHVTNAKAISVLKELRIGFESGEKTKAEITRTLTVYKIENLDTGDSVYRTEIALVVTAPKNMKNIKIIEVVPKTTAKSSDDLVFLGEVPEVLQKDPVLQWVIDSLKKGKSLDLRYIVKKKLASIKSYTLAGGEEVVAPPVEEEIPEEVPEEEEIVPPKPKYGWLVAFLIVLVGLVAYFVYMKKKEKK